LRAAGRVRIVGVRKKIARRIFKREATEFVLAEPEAMLAVALTAPNRLVQISELAKGAGEACRLGALDLQSVARGIRQ